MKRDLKNIDAKVTSSIQYNPGDILRETYSVTALTTNLNHLMDTYATMEFRSLIVEKMADKFVEDNYERITSGINFEQMEASVLDLAKKKFADMLKLEEPVYSRNVETGQILRLPYAKAL